MDKVLSAFEILGISPHSSDAEIRSAWRALVRTYHPDMAKSDPEEANRRMAEINAAVDAIAALSETDKAVYREAEQNRRRAEEQAEQRRRAARAARARAQANQARTEAETRAKTQTEAGAEARKHAQSGPRAQASKCVSSGPSARLSAGAADVGDAVRNLAARAAASFEAAQQICARSHAPRQPRASF